MPVAIEDLRPLRAEKFARILGVGGYRPPRVVTNAEVCEHIDSTDEWIRERSGIEERHWADPSESVVDMAVQAAQKAIVRANISPEQISTVIVATISYPYQTPSAATDVALRIGCATAAAFDISAACAGFCYGVGLANDLISAGSAEYVLVIGVEKLTDFVDINDRSVGFLFADGAGAVVIGPSATRGIGPTVWGSNSEAREAINQKSSWLALKEGDPHYEPELAWPNLQQQGQSVFRWAVYQMPKIAKLALEAAGVAAADLDAFIPHQANVRIIDSMVKVLELPSNVPVARDIRRSGNTSAASVPLAMEAMLESGEAKSGDTALLIGFGAGLVYASQVVQLP
ncbi:MAG TPA: beta-ketoacyl-ACP synthase III [Candidatus Nanopelagicaceae bacterium]|nr:beta-ketoacyl-ACP synthase III [Candidatus Nanopelagicaceae bacterium]